MCDQSRPLRFSVSRSHARLCPQERSSGPRSNARLANQTRCGSVISMSRTFNVSAPACPNTVATLAPPAAQYSRAAPRRRGGVSADERWSCRASGAAFIVTRPPVPIPAPQFAWPNGASASSRSGPPQRVKVLKHDAKERWRRRCHDQRRNLLLFFSTLLNNGRTIILVIEPLSQSDRANSNSCFSD